MIGKGFFWKDVLFVSLDKVFFMNLVYVHISFAYLFMVYKCGK